jgi:hypothetical protein
VFAPLFGWATSKHHAPANPAPLTTSKRGWARGCELCVTLCVWLLYWGPQSPVKKCVRDSLSHVVAIVLATVSYSYSNTKFDIRANRAAGSSKRAVVAGHLGHTRLVCFVAGVFLNNASKSVVRFGICVIRTRKVAEDASLKCKIVSASVNRLQSSQALLVP